MRSVQSDTLSGQFCKQFGKLQSDIGKFFYHLIKHMYTLNKLRVNVDNKLGQCFNSHIGVYPQGDVLSLPFSIYL
jgi:hypothetical protein